MPRIPNNSGNLASDSGRENPTAKSNRPEKATPANISQGFGLSSIRKVSSTGVSISRPLKASRLGWVPKDLLDRI